MKKIAFMLCAAMALTFSSCSKEDNSIFPENIVIRNGYSLNDIYKQAAEKAKDNEISITLPPRVEIFMEESIEVPDGKTLVIAGDAKQPAIINAKGDFTFTNGFTLKNVIIKTDAVQEGIALFSMSEEPVLEANTKGSIVVEEPVVLENVQIAGLQTALLWDGNKKYVFQNITIDNCQVEFDINGSMKQAAINLNYGGAMNLTIQNSTMWQKGDKNFTYFTKYNNSVVPDNAFEADDWKNVEDASWSVTYKNNTFYKLINTQWHNGGRISQQYKKMNVDIENNIWSECCKDILRRIVNSKSAADWKSFVCNQNTWVKDGKFDNAANYNKTEGIDLTTEPAFVAVPEDTDEPNFKPTGSQQVQYKTGDPRWWKK